MQTKEQIELRGAPFPAPLPLPPADLGALFAAQGFSFVNESGVLRLRGEYAPERLGAVNRLLSEKGLSVEVTHNVWTVYEESDYLTADFVFLLAPEVMVPGLDFATTCGKCGKKKVVIDPDVRVRTFKSKLPIVSINGQFTVVRADFAKHIETELRGVHLPPFDGEEKYRYLLAVNHFRHLIISPDEVIGLTGNCNQCGLPRMKTLFGPLRYPFAEWMGDDVVYCDFLNCNAYSQKAYKLIHTFEKSVERDGIVLLTR